jgi:hypothetical protein
MFAVLGRREFVDRVCDENPGLDIQRYVYKHDSEKRPSLKEKPNLEKWQVQLDFINDINGDITDFGHIKYNEAIKCCRELKSFPDVRELLQKRQTFIEEYLLLFEE